MSSPCKKKPAYSIDIYHDSAHESSTSDTGFDSDSDCSVSRKKPGIEDTIRKKQVQLGPYGLKTASVAPIELDTSSGIKRSPQKVANDRASQWRREREFRNSDSLDLDIFLKVQPSLNTSAFSEKSRLLFRNLNNGASRETSSASFIVTGIDDKPRAAEKVIDTPDQSFEQENLDPSVLKFSPPRNRSKVFNESRPMTPPLADITTKKVLSPTKRPPRVPTPPGRPSVDAFWDAEAVNEWNDQHSPRKEWKSRQEHFSFDSSPSKAQSPSKRTKAELQTRKDFETKKHDIAVQFLAELDQQVADGRISELAASTGGVKIVWSKTLNSTAGRANWKRETTKTLTEVNGDKNTETTYQHFASIELAEKVIDDEERLLNVLAHEFCHLCNFMISGIKDQPHGAQFKAWGKKATAQFGDRGVTVTTKHTYQIEYKYIWQCANPECAAEFRRHSKSIDPTRQTCGSCRSQLVQTKPMPRKAGASRGNAYAEYVKLNFAAVKKSMPNANQKQVMAAVAQQYHEEKAALSQSTSVTKSESASPELDLDLESIVGKLGSVALDDK